MSPPLSELITSLLLALSATTGMICNKHTSVMLSKVDMIKLTFPIRPYSSSVCQTLSARFSPECCPIISRKSIKTSSVLTRVPKDARSCETSPLCRLAGRRSARRRVDGRAQCQRSSVNDHSHPSLNLLLSESKHAWVVVLHYLRPNRCGTGSASKNEWTLLPKMKLHAVLCRSRSGRLGLETRSGGLSYEWGSEGVRRTWKSIA